MNITRAITQIDGWNRSLYNNRGGSLLASTQNITRVITWTDRWNRSLYNS